MNDAVPEPIFARHETFHPRYLWLKKAYDGVSRDPLAFRSKDAIVRFGVGKNMVNAIKFWSLAFKITESTKMGVAPTKFGDKIFGKDGLDPYLERAETLWVLHWSLFAPPCSVPVWWIVLNEITGTVVEPGHVLDVVQACVRNNPQWKSPSEGSVKRDMDVFLHMYTTKKDRLGIEEYLDCPFRGMSLVRYTDNKHLRFTFGPKAGLTPLVVAFACVDFARRTGEADGISLARLAVEPGGVGNTFKLNERDIIKYLEDACADTKHISLDNINGAQHLKFDRECVDSLLECVYGADAYKHAGKTAGRYGAIR